MATPLGELVLLVLSGTPSEPNQWLDDLFYYLTHRHASRVPALIASLGRFADRLRGAVES